MLLLKVFNGGITITWFDSCPDGNFAFTTSDNQVGVGQCVLQVFV